MTTRPHSLLLLAIPAILIGALTAIVLHRVHLRRRRTLCRQRGAILAATASWENEGGHINLP